jgi:hypothetical protein
MIWVENLLEKMFMKLPCYRKKIEEMEESTLKLNKAINDYTICLRSFNRYHNYFAHKERSEVSLDIIWEDMYSRFLESNEIKDYISNLDHSHFDPINDKFGLKNKFLSQFKFKKTETKRSTLLNVIPEGLTTPVDQYGSTYFIPAMNVRINSDYRY